MDKKVHYGKGLNRCCGCCKLRIGFLVWGVLKCLGLLVNIIMIVMAARSDNGVEDLYEPYDLNYIEVYVMVKGFLWPPLVLNIISCVFALVWMIKDNPTTRRLVVAYLLIDITNCLIGLVSIIIVETWSWLYPNIILWLITLYLLYVACCSTNFIGADEGAKTERGKFSVVPS